MKRLLSIAICMMVAALAHAVPLFPYFTDVAGDFKDGTPDELAALKIPSQYYSRPSFYKTLNEADSFLKDVLPTSTETIDRMEKMEGAVRVVTYTSPIVDNLIGADAISTIYLVEIPEIGFYVGYSEIPIDNVKYPK